MKALGMDASLEERKELAKELGYSGHAHDSAKMNMFLHNALMKKLPEAARFPQICSTRNRSATDALLRS
jgi:hypothetical protein